MDAILEFVRSLWVVWLMALFVGIVAWAFWPKNCGRFERDAQIPLRDDQ